MNATQPPLWPDTPPVVFLLIPAQAPPAMPVMWQATDPKLSDLANIRDAIACYQSKNGDARPGSVLVHPGVTLTEVDGVRVRPRRRGEVVVRAGYYYAQEAT